MIREEIKQLNTGAADLRKFGLSVGGVLALLGFWFLYRHKGYYAYFLYPGLALVVLGLAAPKTLKAIYIGWMTVALVLGLIVSTLLLSLFYYLVMTPVGLVARCFGKDFLARQLDRNASSYWLLRKPSQSKAPADYERQF